MEEIQIGLFHTGSGTVLPDGGTAYNQVLLTSPGFQQKIIVFISSNLSSLTQKAGFLKVDF